MLPILDAKTIRAWDQFTIDHTSINSIDLMEKAATACFQWISINYNSVDEFVILCGNGNNGGDGLVIARWLLRSGKSVKVWLVNDTVLLKPDCKKNLELLKLIDSVEFIEINSLMPTISPNALVIDAIFGTGIDRRIEGYTADCINFINNINNTIISIDMPSGLLSDMSTDVSWPVVHAHHTLSFQCPKLAFFFKENYRFVGNWHILNIELEPSFEASVNSKCYYQEKSDFLEIWPSRNKFDAKWHYGHALLIAGTKDKVGAALMASEAALRTGVGLLSLQSDDLVAVPLFARLPEAMFINNSKEIQFNKYDAVGVGPGIGINDMSVLKIKEILTHCKKPLVLDADALNIIAQNQWQDSIPINSILTPHAREYERLFGAYQNEFERLKSQQEFSIKHNIYIMFKSAFSVLTTPNGLTIFNSSGNPGMAKGGSGDVLTGIITSLLAQGLSPFDAAKLGMMIHGWAADLAKEEIGETALLPTDYIGFLKDVFKLIQKKSPLN
ncbi:MAG: NAD(P)H-hydrate dehydratase [Bacteroidia bacterium]|nr:NAD(P)H-hydrate dehydratase [Bacteroidia bacterium]